MIFALSMRRSTETTIIKLVALYEAVPPYERQVTAGDFAVPATLALGFSRINLVFFAPRRII